MSTRKLRNREISTQSNMDSNSGISNNIPGIQCVIPQMAEIVETSSAPVMAGNSESKFNFTSILPIFDGSQEQCPEFFFNQFDEIANLAQWTPSHKTILLKHRLRGEARQILQNNVTMQSETNYEKLKCMILDHFVKTKSLLQRQAEFQAIKQIPGMTPRQLALKISSAAKVFLKYTSSDEPQCKTLIENTLLGRFCDALRPDLRVELRKYAPQTFEEAIQRATILDEALTEHSLLVGNVSESPGTNEIIKLIQTQAEIQDAKLEALTLQINSIQNNAEKTTNVPQFSKNTVICQYCGKVGHVVPDCWFFQSLNLQNNSEQGNKHERKNPRDLNTFRRNYSNRRNFNRDRNFSSSHHENRPGNSNYEAGSQDNQYHNQRGRQFRNNNYYKKGHSKPYSRQSEN